MAFEFSHTQKAGITRLQLKGQLLAADEAGLLLDFVENMKANEGWVLADLGELKYLNSEGLNVMLKLLTKARSVGGEVVLCNLSTSVQSLFIITKLTHIFTVFKTKKEAEDYLAGAKKPE